MAKKTSRTRPLGGYSFLRVILALIVLQVGLAAWATWHFSRAPEVSFVIAHHPDKSGVFVASAGEDAPGFDGSRLYPGDVILGVDNIAVDTASEFWQGLREASDVAEVTVQRFGVTFERNLTEAAFEVDELPPGIREDDRPVGIACQDDATYVELKAVDLEGLRHLVKERATEQGVLVYFKRPSEQLTLELPVGPGTFTPTPGLLLLGGVLLMIIVLIGASRTPTPFDQQADTRGVYLALMIFLFGAAALGLASDASLSGSVGLATAGAFGVGLFKATNLEYHVRQVAKGAALEWHTRLAIFVGPLFFVAQLLYYSLGTTRVWWGGDVAPADEGRFQTFWLLLLGTTLLLIVVDAVMLLVRQQRASSEGTIGVRASRIGVGASLILAALALYIYKEVGDLVLAQRVLAGALGVQLLADLVGVLDLPRAYWLGEGVGRFSAAPILELLDELGAALPGYTPQLVVRRSAFDEMGVRLRRERIEDTALLVCEQLERPWIDFLDVLKTEGGTVPRPPSDDPELDPLVGLSAKMRVGLAWPIAEHVGGSDAHVLLLATAEHLGPPPDADAVAAVEALSADFRDLAQAVVFHAGLGAVGAVRPTPRPSVEPADAEPPRPRAASSTRPVDTARPVDLTRLAEVPSTSVSPARQEAGVASQGDKRLRAQLRAAQAELQRLHPTDDIELTAAQRDAVRVIHEDGAPALIIGEHGVGKTLVAQLAHQALGGGPFVRINVTELPNSVLELEIFGDDVVPGRLLGAAGGTLLIEGADRLPVALLDRLMEVSKDAEPHETPRLFFSVDLPPMGDLDDENLATGEVEFTGELEFLEELADRVDAATVMVPPARDQDDARAVLDHFVHRAALRHGKVITDLDDEAAALLARSAWPGNFREMREAVERAVLQCDGKVLQAHHFRLFDAQPSARGAEGGSRPPAAQREDGKALQASKAEVAALKAALDASRRVGAGAGANSGDGHPWDQAFAGSYEDIERRCFEHALHRADGNKSQAARALGLKRTTFINKLKKHGLAG